MSRSSTPAAQLIRRDRWDFCPETCSSRDELKLHWSAYHKPYARKIRVTGMYRSRTDGGWEPAAPEAARPLAGECHCCESDARRLMCLLSDDLPLPPSQSVMGDITMTTTTNTTTTTETTDVSIVLGSLPSLPAPPSLPQFSQAETIPPLSQPASVTASQEQPPTPERSMADTSPSSPVGETSTSGPSLPATTAAAGDTSDTAPFPQASTPGDSFSQEPAASTLWYQAYLAPRRSQRTRLITPSPSRIAPPATSSALASASTSSAPVQPVASSQSQPSSASTSSSSKSNGVTASEPAPSPFVPPTQASISMPPEEDPSIMHETIEIKTPPPHPATPLHGASEKQPGGGTPGSRSNRKRPASTAFKLKFGDAIEPTKQQTSPSKEGVGFRFGFGSAEK